jgi:hypothetical protein
MHPATVRKQSFSNFRYRTEINIYKRLKYNNSGNLQFSKASRLSHNITRNTTAILHSFGHSRPTVTRVDPLPCIYTAIHHTFASSRKWKQSNPVRTNYHLPVSSNELAGTCQVISSPDSPPSTHPPTLTPNFKQNTPSGTTSTSETHKQTPPVRTLRTDPLSAFSLRTPEPTNPASEYTPAQPCPSTPANPLSCAWS